MCFINFIYNFYLFFERKSTIPELLSRHELVIVRHEISAEIMSLQEKRFASLRHASENEMNDKPPKSLPFFLEHSIAATTHSLRPLDFLYKFEQSSVKSLITKQHINFIRKA